MGNSKPKKTNHPIPTLFRQVLALAWSLGAVMAPLSSAMAVEQDSRPIANRREMMANKGSEIRVEGGLSCRMQQDSKGDHCVLRLEDFHTGKVFRLVGETAALEMYQKGMKTVAVVGTITDFQTLTVQSIESL